jgi:hypothetical protein
MSDDKGVFVLKKIPAGQGYSIRVMAPVRPAGAVGGKQGVTVEAGKATDVGTIKVGALPG